MARAFRYPALADAVFVRINGVPTPSTDARLQEAARGCIGTGGTMGAAPVAAARGLADMEGSLARHGLGR